mgnify:CR=1 FL=1|jgi:hypothetical protein
MTICQQLAAMFPELAEDFEERERLGMERYGKPLDAMQDGRDWKREAREELLDSLVYLTAQLERAGTTDEYANIKEARRYALAAIGRIS